MCRLLLVKSRNQFNISDYLKPLAAVARNSQEYQGHGWGCAFWQNDKWKIYRNVNPIWEDRFDNFPQTSFLLAHARSAFRDEGIVVENNMPFFDGKYVFIFNGELHGVKIKETGRIGAEKIFNYIKRFDKGDFRVALEKGVRIIQKRSRFIRALNLMVADRNRVYLNSLFNADFEYFTLHKKRTGDSILVCSEPFPQETGWEKIENHTIEVIE